jgi:hypothetical protein
MHKKAGLILSLLITVAQLCAQKNTTYSELPAKPVEVDGSSAEWREPFRYYDGASKLQFSFRNDSNNLYFCIKTNDELAERKMTASGLEFTIETGKKTSATLTFPTPWQRSKSQVPEGAEMGRGAQARAMKRRMASEIRLMKLKGFVNIPDGIYSIDTLQGLKVALDWDSLGQLTAEYKIPYALLFDKADTAKFYTASIVLKGLDIPAGERVRSQPDQQPSANGDLEDGTTGSMNGNMRGAMGGHDMGNSRTTGPPPGIMEGGGNTMGQDNTIKLKLKLASW